MKRIRVLALSANPIESAATRFRIAQYREPLARRGIDVELRPFLSSRTFSHFYDSRRMAANVAGVAMGGLRRLRDLTAAADVVFVQKQAVMFGPPIVEWLLHSARRLPLIYDFDDALYIRDSSSVYGRAGDWLKSKKKADQLIAAADAVICGNEVLAEHARELGARVEVLPTIVDGDEFKPLPRDPNHVPTIGWIGSHTTFRFLERLFPILASLRQQHEFRLRIVGSGREAIRIEGVEVETLPWRLDRDAETFQSIDIGLYPLADEPFARGKSGFKAIQYMFTGVPFVMSPVGICRDLGQAGVTHHAATTDDEWRAALESFLVSPARRAAMGEAGRRFAVEAWSVERQAETLAGVIRDTLVRRGLYARIRI